ncbi:MAG: type II and III secretion system protein family protein [Caulobacteraceae bacterium]
MRSPTPFRLCLARLAAALFGALAAIALACPATAQMTDRRIELPAGKSAQVELPVDARDVIVTNPKVADVILRSPRRISILGVAAGSTDAVFFDAAGRRILSLDVEVDIDGGGVAEVIDRLLPGAKVHVEGLNGSLILTGEVASASDADRAVQIARAAVSGQSKVLDMLSIAGKDQVMLKVRIVEVDRNVIKQLGFNLQALVGKLGERQFTFGAAPTYAVNGSLLGGLTGGYSVDTTQGGLVPGSNGLNRADATLQAFEEVGLVRTLAEPNLTAVSGEAAKFLAGGEFPVPTGESLTGQVSIEFKPFGVGLGFTPVVLSDGRISLKISTEVSELSNTGAFNLQTGPGGPVLVVPSLTVRRAETTVELPSGGAMMIAGLLEDTTKEDIDAVPGLKSLPVLGALFRSRDYLAGETELVVIVTPYIVRPGSPDQMQTPADGLEMADDLHTILLGKLNKVFKRPPAATAGRTYEGPIGYVVE